MTELVIETTQLCKVYGPKVAVDDLSLQVRAGEVFGFLGPNGAGKSTSVKMLLGLVKPSSGSARLLGAAPGDRTAMAQVGFLPEHFRFHEWMHAHEFLDVHGRLYGLSAAERRARIPELLELVGLGEQANRQLAGFSKGMLQRIGMAQALLNRPRVVFLDEPTSALDPFGRMLVRTIIHRLKNDGVAVFLNSHLLGEVEVTCDRVAFIREGRVLQTLSLSELGAGQLQAELRVDAVTPALHMALAAIPGVVARPSPADPDRLDLMLPGEAALPAIAAATLASGASLYALTPHRRSLEELFLSVIGTQDSGQ